MFKKFGAIVSTSEECKHSDNRTENIFSVAKKYANVQNNMLYICIKFKFHQNVYSVLQ